MKKTCLLTLCFSALLFVRVAAQQAGVLDNTFGENGVAQHSYLEPINAVPLTALPRPDGKVVLVGCLMNHLADLYFYASRLNSDGTVDSTFGDHGLVKLLSVEKQPIATEILAATLQDDGKILVAGTGLFGPSYLMRLNENGSVDTDFGDRGLVLHTMLLNAIAAMPDGRFLVSGTESKNGLLMRYQYDGSVDATFGNNGKVEYLQNELFNSTYGLALLPDGKILFSGITKNNGSVLGRCLADGSMDSTFQGTGVMKVASLSEVLALHYTLAGQILLAGRGLTPNTIAISRFHADGSVDLSLGQTGTVFLPPSSGLKPPVSLFTLSNGKIYIAATNFKTNLLCYENDGTADSTFATGGVFQTTFYTGATYFFPQPDGTMWAINEGFPSYTPAIRITPNGSYIPWYTGKTELLLLLPEECQEVAGVTFLPSEGLFSWGRLSNFANSNSTPSWVRSLGEDGKPKTTFGDDNGFLIDSFQNERCIFNGLFQRSDKKLLMFGSTYMGAYHYFLARYHPDGTRDSSYHQNGVYVLPDVYFSPSYDHSLIATELPGKKVLLIGTLGKNLYLGRLRDDDTFDPDFDTDGLRKHTLSLAGAMKLNSTAVQPDGKVLLGGYLYTTGSPNYYLVIRTNPDGTLDSSWGNNGILYSTFLPSKASAITSLKVRENGAVLAGGYYTQSASLQKAAFIQFKTNGQRDSTFGDMGVVMMPTEISNTVAAEVRAFAIQPDGKILSTGGPLSSFETVVLRHLPNGTIDSAFAQNGVFSIDLGGHEFAHGIFATPDKKILVGGQVDGKPFWLRLLPDLVLDDTDLSAASDAPLVYPNPLRERTTFQYTLPEAGPVSLTLFDRQGRLVQPFFTNEIRPAGTNVESLQVTPSLPAGVYTLHLLTPRGQAAVQVTISN